MLTGIAMKTNELKELVLFFKGKGVSPTVKELCSTNIYISQYQNRKAS